eukprot:scaffold9207_cov84-Cyclotella_meneghiniana.AAC.4
MEQKSRNSSILILIFFSSVTNRSGSMGYQVSSLVHTSLGVSRGFDTSVIPIEELCRTRFNATIHPSFVSISLVLTEKSKVEVLSSVNNAMIMIITERKKSLGSAYRNHAGTLCSNFGNFYYFHGIPKD